MHPHCNTKIARRLAQWVLLAVSFLLTQTSVAAPFIAGGQDHTCAVRSDGAVLCWGLNSWGQLGDGSLNSNASPVVVIGITSAISVAAGQRCECDNYR